MKKKRLLSLNENRNHSLRSKHLPSSPIPKGIIWKDKADKDYDYVVITNLADVVEELKLLRFAV